MESKNSVAEHSAGPPCSLPSWLLGQAFVIEYSPNCHRKWMVRLVGYRKGRIDKKAAGETNDAIGYGDSITDAAEDAAGVFRHQKEMWKA